MTDAGPARARLSAALERVAQGDKAALRAVYDHTSPKLFGICLHILGDRALAEDVLQEVYLKVWRGAGTFDPQRASPITWLSIIARNSAVDWRRASARHDEAVGLAGEAAVSSSHGAWTSDAADRHRLMHRCMDELEAEPRIAIRAAFLEGYTYSEVATRTGVPLGTMKSWIRRGLAQVRKCIENG